MNKVILMGRLVQNIELKKTNNGKSVMQNRIAVQRQFKNNNNEYESDFINLVIWNQSAEYVSTYIKKGDRVLVEGRLNTRSYESNGNKVYVTEVIVDRINSLEPFKKDQQQQSQSQQEDFFTDVEVDDDLDLPF